jgi:hypothetical protein
LTSKRTTCHFFYYLCGRNLRGNTQTLNKQTRLNDTTVIIIKMKKKLIAATMVALFLTAGANSANVENVNVKTVNDVVMNLNQDVAMRFVPMYQKFMIDVTNVRKSDRLNEDQKTAKIEDLKNEYAEKFSYFLDTNQNDVVINNLPLDYINNRLAK